MGAEAEQCHTAGTNVRLCGGRARQAKKPLGGWKRGDLCRPRRRRYELQPAIVVEIVPAWDVLAHASMYPLPKSNGGDGRKVGDHRLKW
jgi:hypothetical protein